MSKSDLKAALGSLQVKKPLKLHPNSLSFKAPQPATPVENSSQVQNQTEDKILSQDLKPTPDAKQSEVAIETKDQIQSQVLNSTSDENVSKDENITPDKNLSGVPKVVQRSSQPRRATEQDRAVVEIAEVKSKLSTGYTKVPNSILMEMVNGDLSKAELKILLLVARMTISFNRSFVSLSKSAIERMTKIQGGVVLQAVHSLEQKGLIKKIPGDQYKPNQLGLIFEETLSPKASSGEKTSRDENAPEDKNISPGEVRNSTYKKDNLEIINKNSLSTFSEILQNYFSNLRPKRKREAELKALEDLKLDFSIDQIEECFQYVTKRGLTSSGEKLHSPMAYLAKVISEILVEVEKEKQKQLELRSEAERQEEERIRKVDQEQREMAETSLRELEFRKMFTEEAAQNKIIAEYAKQFPMLKPDSKIVRNLAIGAWWESNFPGKIPGIDM